MATWIIKPYINIMNSPFSRNSDLAQAVGSAGVKASISVPMRRRIISLVRMKKLVAITF